MSEEIKELTDKEAMKILGEFATTCYDKGVKDALIGVSVIEKIGAMLLITNKMRWRDPDPGKDGRSVEHGKEIKRDFMSRPELRNREAEKRFRRKPYGKE